MFIANLMASVLALAMVGASTASVSEFENNAVRSAVNTSFVASPKRAYYDPTETYGTTLGKIYNYTDCVFQLEPQHGPTAPTTLPNGDANLSYTQVSTPGYEHYSEWYLLAQLKYQGEPSNWNISLEIDLYINGVFTTSLTSNPNHGGVLEPHIYYETDPSANQYIWLFNHQEPEPYTPVDILGDIAEGITGGIVPVAEGIGSGLQSLVQGIFLNAAHDGLSVFGIVIICFAGLALALGLSRWVLNFVDTLGARDR